MNEPAIDLAVVLALVSSYKDRPIDEKAIAFGEVGLSGEVRGVSMAQQRALEAKKLGFTTVIMPQVSVKAVGQIDGVRILGVRSLKDAVERI